MSVALSLCSLANVMRVWLGILPLISSFLSLIRHAQAIVLFACELVSVYMLTVGVVLPLKLAFLMLADIAAPSGSTFFWIVFSMITWMGSNHGAGSLDLWGMIGWLTVGPKCYCVYIHALKPSKFSVTVNVLMYEMCCLMYEIVFAAA